MEASTVVKVDTEIVDASQKCWEDFDIAEGTLSNIIRLGWAHPTLIQSVVLGSMKRNIVAQVKSNIGTTSAFIIASLMCAVPDLQALQVICLATTRDLNRHNFAGFQELASGTPIRVGIAEAGIHELPQCHVLCATLGSLQNVIKLRIRSEKAKQARMHSLQEVRTIVLDDADKLINSTETLSILKILTGELPASCQKLLFSTENTDNIRELVACCMSPAINITVERIGDLNSITQFVVKCDYSCIFAVVLDIARQIRMKTCVLWVNTRKCASALQCFLTEHEQPAEIYSEKTDEERNVILEKLERGEVKFLIATNGLSKCFEEGKIDFVINIDIPFKYETREPDHVTYLHRIEYAWKFGQKGFVVNLISDLRDQQGLLAIQRIYQTEIRSITVEELAKEIEAKIVDI